MRHDSEGRVICSAPAAAFLESVPYHSAAGQAFEALTVDDPRIVSPPGVPWRPVRKDKTMTAKTKKTKEPQDLLVYWCTCDDCGCMQVSSSDHKRWYDITVQDGSLRCSCPDATYRPYSTCKHVWAAAQHLESHTPSTEGQRLFSQSTARDRGREALRIVKDYKDDHDPWPGAGADVGGGHTPEEPEQPEESEGPAAAIATNPRLEDLFE